MKYLTIPKLKSWKPCYSAERIDRVFDGRKRLSAKDIAELDIPSKDKIWVLIRFLDGKNQIEFALRCAERILPIYENQYPNDNRISACIVATRDFINNAISEENFRAADYVATYAQAAADVADSSAAMAAAQAAADVADYVATYAQAAAQARADSSAAMAAAQARADVADYVATYAQAAAMAADYAAAYAQAAAQAADYAAADVAREEKISILLKLLQGDPK